MVQGADQMGQPVNRIGTLMCDASDILGVAAAMQSRWQHRARSEPDLMERVLAEVRVMKVEDRIRVSAAAAAEDLYKRWSKP